MTDIVSSFSIYILLISLLSTHYFIERKKKSLYFQRLILEEKGDEKGQFPSFVKFIYFFLYHLLNYMSFTDAVMSADDKESSMLKGLEAGAAFYIVKPVNYDDLKNIWQYAVGPRKDNSVDMQDVGPAPEEESPVEKTPDDPVDIESVSSVNEVNQSKRDPKKKASKRVIEDSGKENSDAVSPKRTKVVWTSALHTRFLEAVRKIGLESKRSLTDLCIFFHPSKDWNSTYLRYV